MLGVYILLTLSIIPHDIAIIDRVETIELNHFYDESGKHVFDQHIFRANGEIIDWRLVKAKSEAVYADRGAYRLDWRDGWQIRSVRAAEYRETWTQYDPELAERGQLPKELRRELTPIIHKPTKPKLTNPER
jgi:hypothetical protein